MLFSLGVVEDYFGYSFISFYFNMAKRGRKRKGYFYEEQEQAVVDYILAQTKEEKDKIFNMWLLPAFTKMIESIIRRYKLYLPDEEFDETFNDTISFLMTKIEKYKEKVFKYDEIEIKQHQNEVFLKVDEKFYIATYKDAPDGSPEYIKVTFEESTVLKYKDLFKDSITSGLTKYYKLNEYHYKAYSYCGTICKNYLFFKLNQFKKHQEKQESYDIMYESFTEDSNYIEDGFDELSPEEFVTELISNVCKKIQNIINEPREINLTYDERRVGLALIDLFENWEELFNELGSNKFNKSSILLYLKDATNLTTPKIRNSMKKYKTAYYDIKKIML